MHVTHVNIFAVSQVSGLSEELRSLREERDALMSAQSSLNEDHQRLKEQTANAQDQLLKMESDLVDAQLKEAELTQQLTETSERLQTEKSTLLASLEEATQKVRSHFTQSHQPPDRSDLTLFFAAVELRAGVCSRRERRASV